MINLDYIYLLKWFFYFFLVGVSFLPITVSIFSSLKDKGYIFSKIIGSAVISYTIFIAGLLHLLKFSTNSIFLVLLIFALGNYLFLIKTKTKISFYKTLVKNIRLFVLEEILFLSTLIFWSFIRGNLPDINGLEKFMDFGFLNSILRADYFPPKDMWYSPLSINYYYFGHLITAVYVKMSSIPSTISYNLMISTLFALTFTTSFSIGLNIFDSGKRIVKALIAGVFSAFFVSFAGNLTTIYSFFKPYMPADHPIPFWKLQFLPFNFPNDYWYPNATRFIPFTIHEFPIYSFVVSDLHGHVLDIPFVLLTIVYCFTLLNKKGVYFYDLIIYSFLLSIMYMTNAWDGVIYFLLFTIALLYISIYLKGRKIKNLYESLKNLAVIFVGFIAFSVPFSLNFKPFVSGIGVLCAPKFLTDIGRIGPFLFEVNHCQKSPVWQLALLYGCFYFFVFSFLIFLKYKKNYKATKTDHFVLILILLSTILIIIPEFLYIKDIYPLHYRANTMFKLAYESFIMLSISSGFIAIKLLIEIKNHITRLLFFVISLFTIILVFVYPFFAITSYYRNLKSYNGLDGLKYLSKDYPEDYKLINWLNNNIKNQPVVLEANGDSYTNYARISANTGMPTVLGWTVHEWLWRGTYNIVAPRISDVQILYTSNDIKTVSNLIRKYKISYIVVSGLEKEKYPNLTENVFNKVGNIIYQNKQTKLYKINYAALK